MTWTRGAGVRIRVLSVGAQYVGRSISAGSGEALRTGSRDLLSSLGYTGPNKDQYQLSRSAPNQSTITAASAKKVPNGRA
jgi:hypothetical protein